MRRFPVAPVLAALAAATLVTAFIVLLPVRAGGGATGWNDLAAFAGFLVLTLVAGAFFASALVAARAGWGRLPRALVVLAVAGVALGALPALTLAGSALAVAGLASVRGAWQRAA